MQRFKNKSDVTIGSRVIFDNLTSFLKDLPKVRMIGDVVSTDSENNDVTVNLYIVGHEEPIEVKLPFYLLQ